MRGRVCVIDADNNGENNTIAGKRYLRRPQFKS